MCEVGDTDQKEHRLESPLTKSGLPAGMTLGTVDE
jgi:hypothetical protein